MKRWSGGTLIVVLSFVLFVRYTFIVFRPTKQTKQSAYDFFRSDAHNGTEAKETGVVAKPKISITAKNQEKKPFLINIKGLDELYDSVNISSKDRNSFATWAQLRVVLSRSDALPETAKGIEEASVAWRELLSVIKQDELLQIKTNGSHATDVKCPYAVSSFDEPVNSNRNLLEIPCGLVVDSSVTLIGIPNGKNESFQFELEGARFVHEQKPPIILKYSVYLPEENSTKEPFIVQNTWTNEAGWGKEERCLRGRSTNNVQVVDGLPSCNERLARSTTAESHNVSQLVSKKQNDSSMEHGHVTENFPFMEGNLFSATLWTGLEGFHMTVNGRHETSFKYRENLEPWLVSKVRVTGGVGILSGIAKGLPVSEDMDRIIDVDQLKAPPLLRKKGRLVLFVGVFSTGNNFERRMALRRSWMQYQAVRSGSVAVRFIIGFHKNAEVNHDLWREAQAYGDIQLMPFVDYYSLISLKTIAVCILGTKVVPAKYIMKMDDDAFVRIDELLSSLKTKTTSGLLYGLMSFQSSPHRDKDSKWYISTEEWPKDSYPPWAHGPGYIISRDIAKFIVQGHQRRFLKLFKLEDVAMGIWVENYKHTGNKVKYFTDERFYNAGCDTDYILAHYQNPRKLLCLWEKLQKERQAICCE